MRPLKNYLFLIPLFVCTATSAQTKTISFENVTPMHSDSNTIIANKRLR